jgi:hypothetical protein
MNERTGQVNAAAVLSMLHEGPHTNSATRLFRGHPVLAWTLQRLSRGQGLGSMTILCWEDQVGEVSAIAEEEGAHVLAKGPRLPTGSIDAIAAAQRWADGWRGGLLNTCDFDQGFHGPWVREIADELLADALVLVDPASALVDSVLIDQMIDRARQNPAMEMIFSPAAPGLGGVLLRPAMLERLSAASVHPGKLLHYLPDAPGHDPCSGDGCLPVPAPVARTTHRFKLDSQRQIDRISRATISLNGQLIHSAAEELVARLAASDQPDELPREVVLEINTRRQTRAIYRPAAHQIPPRPEMTLGQAEALFEELGRADDLRLTLSGVGDPMLSGQLFDIIAAAQRHGIRAIHVESDWVGIAPEAIERLAAAPVDVVSVHLPATTQSTYEAVMGVNAIAEVMDNVRRFLDARRRHGGMTPILTPVFVKCRNNLAEMEAWYDHWLRALGSAVIAGPSDFAGLIPDCAVADMSPPKRRPCGRLNHRMTILCDGRIVSCEEDVLGRQCMGTIGERPIAATWRESFNPLRADHATGDFSKHPTCAACRQWHRP